MGAAVAVAALIDRRRRCRVSRCRSRRRRADRRRRSSPLVAPSRIASCRGRPSPGRKPRSSAPTRAAARVQNVEAVPAGLDRAMSRCAALAASARIAAPSGRASAPWPTISIGCLAFLSVSSESMRCRRRSCERLRPGAEIVVSRRSDRRSSPMSPIFSRPCV